MRCTPLTLEKTGTHADEWQHSDTPTSATRVSARTAPIETMRDLIIQYSNEAEQGFQQNSGGVVAPGSYC